MIPQEPHHLSMLKSQGPTEETNGGGISVVDLEGDPKVESDLKSKISL